VRLAIDAANLPNDTRGMGRVVRGYLRLWLADPSLEVTLLGRTSAEERAIGADFGDRAVRTARASTARRARDYDCVWFPWNGMRFEAAAPALLTLHDVFAFSYPHSQAVARWREQAPIRHGARQATHISTPSEWSRGEIQRVLGVPGERITAIHHAPDPFWFPGEAAAQPAAANAGRSVVAVGLGEARKNPRLLVEACARALHAPDERLIVVGDIADEARKMLESRNVPHRIVSAGDTELRSLYRSATLVAVPSLAEGFGLVAIEAMACGAPVLAANASALPEATGGAALLLDPHDPEAWARAIRRVFDAPELRAQLAAKSLERFASCDREEPARRTLALLRTLAGNEQ
jgi:glycosyltransferase involved in cell wall biosynthesis